MNRFLQLGVNKKGRDFVIGDIHGRYTDLMHGLERVNFDYEIDRLIAVGDLIDRGKENIQVLELIGEPWFHTVLGNHEIMMADALERPSDWNMWVQNGGDWYYLLNEHEKHTLNMLYKTLIEDILPYAIELTAENGERVGITHTDTPKQWPWWEVRKHFQTWQPSITDYITNNILWARWKIQDTEYNKEVLGIDIVVHGHTPSKKRVWRGNAVYIDHGAYNPYQMQPVNVMELLEEHERRIRKMEKEEIRCSN